MDVQNIGRAQIAGISNFAYVAAGLRGDLPHDFQELERGRQALLERDANVHSHRAGRIQGEYLNYLNSPKSRGGVL